MKQTKWKTVGECLKYAYGYGQGNGPRFYRNDLSIWYEWLDMHSDQIRLGKQSGQRDEYYSIPKST